MELTIEFALTNLQNKLENLVDDTTMLYVHKRFADRISPWVPYREGLLDSSVEIRPDYIRYKGPYAHYVYVGEVYGPNFPIKDENGNIIDWRSKKDEKKHPMGRDMHYTTESHPLASKEWDKAAMQTQLEPFTKEVKEYLIRRMING